MKHNVNIPRHTFEQVKLEQSLVTGNFLALMFQYYFVLST